MRAMGATSLKFLQPLNERPEATFQILVEARRSALVERVAAGLIGDSGSTSDMPTDVYRR